MASCETCAFAYMDERTGEAVCDLSLDEDELQLRFHGSGQAGKSAYLTFVIESLTDRKMEAYLDVSVYDDGTTEYYYICD